MAILEAVHELVDGHDLGAEAAAAALREVVDGDVSPAVLSAFLVALRMKGETPEEIAGLASTMRDAALPVTPRATGLVDTCGTGGDGKGTANISTTAAFVVAGAGIPVAKHGNRALSSRSGSADVLESLGVRLDLTAEQVAACIDTAGIGFMFAPAFHPAMAKVMPVRRELAMRTAFNVLGPLTNPARPSYQLVGVGAPELAELVAGALREMGTERALVIHGAGGADELTLAGDNLVFKVEGGDITRYTFSAEDTGLTAAPLGSLEGGEAEDNAKLLQGVLDGHRSPIADCVALNAAGALVAAGAAGDIREGIGVAIEAIASGAARAALERLVAASASF